MNRNGSVVYHSRNHLLGAWFVGAAALLWGTDSVFRYPIADSIDPTFIVFAEHLIGTFALLIWVVARFGRGVLRLSRREWAAAIFVGALGSAVATTIFTLSFRYVNPSIAVLLQKLQPVLVVLLAYGWLGERPRKAFYAWGGVALLAGVALSFPDFKFDFEVKHTKGVLFAFGAAVLWAASTVGGKILLERIPVTVATFWRYFFGLLTLSLMLLSPTHHEPLAVGVLKSWPVAQAMLYISFISGIIPMALYYGGLSRTTAGLTTFVELTYPISAVVLNAVFLAMPLSKPQLAAGFVLIFAVTRIGLAGATEKSA